LTVERRVNESADRRLARELGSAGSLDLESEQRRDRAQQPGLGNVRPRPQPELADDLLGDTKVDRGHAGLFGEKLALLRRRAGRDREDGASRVDQGYARPKRSGRPASGLGEAGAGLDGLGNGFERGTERARRAASTRL